MTVRQYKRRIRLTVGPKEGGVARSWVDLDLNAKIDKTDSKKPDKGVIQVWNLSEDSLGFVQQDDMQVILQAGYEENPEIVFRGDIDEVELKYDKGIDVVAEIRARDGGKAYNDGRLVESYAGPVTSHKLLYRLASSMGLRYAQIPSTMQPVQFTQGWTFAGPSRDAIDEIVKSLDGLWTIQDDELVITAKGEPTGEEAFLLSPATGLVGFPEITKKKKQSGVKFKCLLNGRIRPRRLVMLESVRFKGPVIPKKVEHQIDSGFGQEFYTVVEGRDG